MTSVEKILFPVDLSEASPKLAADVIFYAQKLDAEVHLLLVTANYEKFKAFNISRSSMEAFGEEVLAGGRKKLAEFVSEYFHDFPRKRVVAVQGDPTEEILKYIAAENIDLVIMGTHGRKGLDRIVFGSVAHHIVTHSPVPVLTINPYRRS